MIFLLILKWWKKAAERLGKAEQKSRYATLFAIILPVPEALLQAIPGI